MAKIKINGIENLNNSISFSNNPTILTVEAENSGATRASLKLYFRGDSTIDPNTQYYIRLGGEEILSVYGDLSKAINRYFFITNLGSNADIQTTTQTIVNAFKNCPYINSRFNIYVENLQCVVLQAKEKGRMFNLNNIETNLPTTYLYKKDINVGTNGSDSVQNYNTILVDIYTNNTISQDRIGESNNTLQNVSFLTQLQKTMLNNSCSFDLSPILQSQLEYGSTVAFQCNIKYIDSLRLYPLSNTYTNYFTYGYMMNENSPKAINGGIYQGLYFAQDVSNGNADTTYYNKTILYVGTPKINFSLYSKNTASSVNATINYLDSRKQQIATESKNIVLNTNLTDVEVSLNESNFNNAFYIDIVLPEIGTIEYQCIKPYNYTNNVKRIYWRNSLGGVSFFDFATSESENYEIEVTTYKTNNFNFYTNDYVSEKILKNETEKTFTIESHLFMKDGKYIFDDMVNSSYLWSFNKNGRQETIILDSFSLEEQDTANIYKANLTYKIV